MIGWLLTIIVLWTTLYEIHYIYVNATTPYKNFSGRLDICMGGNIVRWLKLEGNTKSRGQKERQS